MVRVEFHLDQLWNLPQDHQSTITDVSGQAGITSLLLALCPFSSPSLLPHFPTSMNRAVLLHHSLSCVPLPWCQLVMYRNHEQSKPFPFNQCQVSCPLKEHYLIWCLHISSVLCLCSLFWDSCPRHYFSDLFRTSKPTMLNEI